MIPHIMIIQSAYDDPRLSERRLAIAEHTSVVALRYQTRKPVVHIQVNPKDPLLEARLSLYRSTGCEVRPLYREHGWKLYKENWELPEGRKIVSRMDDDDIIARDFCERTYNAAPPTGECNLIWPNGYVFWRETVFLLHHPGIQFVTLATDQMTDPHQEQHWQYCKTWPTKVVSEEPGWIWVRHGDAATSTMKRYRQRKLRGISTARCPVNLRAILRAIEPSGRPSADYHEHRKQKHQKLDWVIRENQRNAPRSTGVHAESPAGDSTNIGHRDRIEGH